MKFSAPEKALQVPVVSPCISVCALNAQEICLGCGRSLQEIADWSAADEGQRRYIVEKACERLEQGISA